VSLYELVVGGCLHPMDCRRRRPVSTETYQQGSACCAPHRNRRRRPRRVAGGTRGRGRSPATGPGASVRHDVAMPELSRRAVLRLGAGATVGAAGVWPLSALQEPKTFPQLAIVMFGGTLSSSSVQQNIAKYDVAILSMWRLYGGEAGIVNGIKSYNPKILVGNYTNMVDIAVSTSDTPGADVRAKVAASIGPNGIGDWYGYNAAGQHTREFSSEYYDSNLTLLVTPDGSGHHFPEWMAHRDWTSIISIAPYDIWFSDLCLYAPNHVVDWNRSGVTGNYPTTNERARGWWRAGQAAYYNTASSLKSPGMTFMVNTNSDLNNAIFPANGATFTDYTNIVGGAFLEGTIGETWSPESRGSWSMMMGWYNAVFNQLKSPKMVLFNPHIYTTTDYQTQRYAMASCLLNNGYHCPTTGSYDGSLPWFDEFNLAGGSTTKWLGTAVDPPQTTAWSNGVYMRRFQNGIALCNPKGNGRRTVTPPSGYTRFLGTQANPPNNGAAVTSTVTLADRDGLLLVKTGTNGY
jgi:hypothetical protein